jgi:hypothetical protein
MIETILLYRKGVLLWKEAIFLRLWSFYQSSGSPDARAAEAVFRQWRRAIF